jgi:DNA-binding transcriptional regulator PaaX
MRHRKGKEITRIILKGILIAGVISIASTSPYFVSKALPRLVKYARYKLKKGKKDKKLYNAFYYLRSKGMINVENKGGQIYISLTKEGKKIAGKYQIDDMQIEKPEKWDGKWRILIFDIKDKQKIKREALRGKIIQLGFFQLQKSVWVYPYNFQIEIVLLRSFFNLTNDEMKIVTASEIEDDKKIKIHFNLV